MELEKIFENVKSEVLTEDVKEKLKVLIEAKVSEISSAKIEELEEKFEDYKEQEITKLEEKAVEWADTFVIDQLDSYCDYVAETYVEENKLAIDNGIKAQLYEKMVVSAKEFLAKNQISENKIEESDDLVKENEELKEEASRAVNETIELKKKLKGKDAIFTFNEVTADLADSEVEKMKELAEDYDIDDVKSFKSKLEILKESISSFTEDTDVDKTKSVNEDIDDADDFDTSKILQERTHSSAWDGQDNDWL